MLAKSAAVNFSDDRIAYERDLEKELKAKNPDGTLKGGLVGEKITGADGKESYLVHIANPYEDHPTIMSLPSRCSPEEIGKIRDRILPMRESYEILSAMAVAYEMRTPLIIEGETAIGKTFLVNRFTELLYGPGTKPIDFYCSGQTDVSELMAKWVPKVENARDEARWKEFVSSESGAKRLGQIAEEMEAAPELSDEQRLSLLKVKLQSIATELGFVGKANWELQLGAVPKAMLARLDEKGQFHFDGEGHGFPLKVDEIGLAKPNVTNALLKLRGENGKVAESIQLWEHGGRVIKAGAEFWVVMTTNPPEAGYLERNEVDPALARGAVFLRMGGLSPESLKLSADRYFNYKMGNSPAETPRNCILPLHQHPELGAELAEIAGVFHAEFASAIAKGEKGGRQQKIPATLDDMARLAEYCLVSQVRSRDTGELDLCETLRRGVRFVYTNRLADPSMKQHLTEAFEKGLTDETMSVKNFRGQTKTRKEIIDTLVHEASRVPEKLGVVNLDDRRKVEAKERAENEYLDTRAKTVDMLRERAEQLSKLGRHAEADKVLKGIERLMTSGKKDSPDGKGS